MIIAHLLIGLVGGLLSAVWAGVVLDLSIWSVLLVFIVAGNLMCIASVAAAMIAALICPAQRRSVEAPTA